MTALSLTKDALDGQMQTLIVVAGSFVFAVSGGLAGFKARLDLFGVLVLAAGVGLSGGALRDIMLGIPVTGIFDWRVVLSVILAGFFSFVAGTRLLRWQRSIGAFDAVGLSLFSVIGTVISLQHNAGPIPSSLLGMVTAVGGGAMRDIILNRVPAVLREGLYAVPALLGASVVVLGYELGIASIAWYGFSAGLCLAVRFMGMVFDVNLPRARHAEE